MQHWWLCCSLSLPVELSGWALCVLPCLYHLVVSLVLITSSFPLTHFPVFKLFFIDSYESFMYYLLVWEYLAPLQYWVFLARNILSFSYDSCPPAPAPAKWYGFLYKRPMCLRFSYLSELHFLCYLWIKFSLLYFLNCYILLNFGKFLILSLAVLHNLIRITLNW